MTLLTVPAQMTGTVVLRTSLLGFFVVVTALLGDRRVLGVLAAALLATSALTGSWAVGVAETLAAVVGVSVCWALGTETDETASWPRRVGWWVVLTTLLGGTYVAVFAWLSTVFRTASFLVALGQGVSAMLPSALVGIGAVSLASHLRSEVVLRRPTAGSSRIVAGIVGLWLCAGYGLSYVFIAFERASIAQIEQRLSPAVASVVQSAGPDGRTVTVSLGALAFVGLYLTLYRSGFRLGGPTGET